MQELFYHEQKNETTLKNLFNNVQYCGNVTGGFVGKEDRGFASVDRSKQREIASKGGKAAHAKGRAHEWTPEEAREAGRKGGETTRDRNLKRLEKKPLEAVSLE